MRNLVASRGVVGKMYQLLVADHMMTPVVAPFTVLALQQHEDSTFFQDIVLFALLEELDPDSDEDDDSLELPSSQLPGLHGVVILLNGDVHYQKWR